MCRRSGTTIAIVDQDPLGMQIGSAAGTYRARLIRNRGG